MLLFFMKAAKNFKKKENKMGVVMFASTMPGGLTPICNRCMGSADFDIAQEEYDEEKVFWDRWICPECRDKKFCQ